MRWLGRRGHLDERAVEELRNEAAVCSTYRHGLWRTMAEQPVLITGETAA